MNDERTWLARNWQKLLAGLFWVAAFAAYVIYSKQNELSPLGALKQIADYVQTSNIGPLIYIGIYTLRPVFLFSAAILTIGAGALFGPVWGAVYAVIGSNMGASLAYFIGRFFGEGMVGEQDSESLVGRYVKKMRDSSFETVFMMRLLFMPYDLVNYLAGILRVNFLAFLTATVLGSVPGTISFVLFGASSGLDSGSPKFDPKILAISVAIFLISLGISKVMKKREAAKAGKAE